MPLIVRKYNFAELKNLTKNFKYFYYHGEIQGFADTLEYFSITFPLDTLDETRLNRIKLNEFINCLILSEEKFKNNLFFHTGYFKRKNSDKFNLALKIYGNHKYGEIKDEQFFLVEEFEKELGKFIQKNNLTPEIITKDPTKFGQVTIEQTWDPRHPDPNYMFLIKEEGECNTPTNVPNEINKTNYTDDQNKNIGSKKSIWKKLLEFLK
jgi:hypothetical protein